jgi:hypothetical protein
MSSNIQNYYIYFSILQSIFLHNYLKLVNFEFFSHIILFYCLILFLLIKFSFLISYLCLFMRSRQIIIKFYDKKLRFFLPNLFA